MRWLAAGAYLLMAACADCALADAESQAGNIVARGKQQQPAFAILAEQQAGFEDEWREQLRRQLVVGTPGSPDAISDAIATSLALLNAGAYLDSAGDASLDALFQQQRVLVTLAQTDARLCARLLNTPSARRDEAGETPWLLRKPYRKLQPALQESVTHLVLDAQDKPARALPADDAERFMQRTLGRMSARYGPDSLDDYDAMLDDNAGPARRCKGLHQLFETINALPPQLRAQMVREFFGD